MPLPLRLFQDRAHADDQRQFAILDVEGEAQRAGPGLLHLLDLGPGPGIARMPLCAERLVGPHHVLDGHGRAVRELRFGAQGEFDPFPIRAHLDRFGQKTVQGEGFVPGTAHQGLVSERGELPGNSTLEDVRIEAVKAPYLSRHDATAGGGIGVGIGQGYKILWECGLAIHSYGVLGLGGCRGRRADQEKHATSMPCS